MGKQVRRLAGFYNRPVYRYTALEIQVGDRLLDPDPDSVQIYFLYEIASMNPWRFRAKDIHTFKDVGDLHVDNDALKLINRYVDLIASQFIEEKLSFLLD